MSLFYNSSQQTAPGSINLKGFLDLAARLAHAHQDKEEDDALYEAFRLPIELSTTFISSRVFDRTGSGFIPAKEFSNFCKILGEPFSEAESVLLLRSALLTSQSSCY
jgi:Ca2+-binding EF-hand superfamily protein